MNELLPLIHSKNQKLVDDFAAGDAAALASSFYTDDACLIAPDGKVTKGLPDITNLFARLLQAHTPSFDVHPRTDDHNADANGSGDLIYVIGATRSLSRMREETMGYKPSRVPGTGSSFLNAAIAASKPS